MRFAHADLLWLLLIVPLLFALFTVLERIARKRLLGFAPPAMLDRLLKSKNGPRRYWKMAAF